MGRTGRSWGLILLFYFIYYSCLAIFFISMLAVFLKGTVPASKPSLTGKQSLLKMSPGLGFRPQPDVTNTLIRFTPEDNTTYEPLVTNMNNFLEKYKYVNSFENTRFINGGSLCSDSSDTFAKNNLAKYKDDRVCKFPLKALSDSCSGSRDAFGYASGKPCVLLKMNRVFGWMPQIAQNKSNNVQLMCRGENPADRENLGQVEYFPSVNLGNATHQQRRGVFYSSYFPYMGQNGYRSPLVAVVFSNIKRQVIVMVECRLENVLNAKVDKMLRVGVVRFEVLIEGNPPKNN